MKECKHLVETYSRPFIYIDIDIFASLPNNNKHPKEHIIPATRPTFQVDTVLLPSFCNEQMN